MPQTEPESPCIRSCTLHPEADFCLGCFRMLEEITRWSSYSAQEKLEVLGQLEERKRAYQSAIARRKRGG